jgi:hypothetical protein
MKPDVRVGYLGFLDDRPHVEQAGGLGGPRTMTIYVSRAAARRAYEDVRRVQLVVDRDDQRHRRKKSGR